MTEIAGYRYLCEAVSKDAFVSQLVRYIASGHWIYFAHRLKDGKDPRVLDEKLVAKFGLAKPAWKRTSRARRRGGKGTARPNIHYLRYGSFYVLIATKGRMHWQGQEDVHPLFVEYPKQVQHICRKALHFAGYSIRYTYSQAERRRKVFIRLNKQTFQALREELAGNSLRGGFYAREAMEGEFRRQAWQWQPYKPVCDQLGRILREVNKLRRRARFPQLRDSECIPTMMRVPSRIFIDKGGRIEENADKCGQRYR